MTFIDEKPCFCLLLDMRFVIADDPFLVNALAVQFISCRAVDVSLHKVFKRRISACLPRFEINTYLSIEFWYGLTCNLPVAHASQVTFWSLSAEAKSYSSKLINTGQGFSLPSLAVFRFAYAIQFNSHVFRHRYFYNHTRNLQCIIFRIRTRSQTHSKTTCWCMVMVGMTAEGIFSLPI